MKSAFLIKKPSVTEKSARFAAAGKYVFVVEPGSTKNEIRKAVEREYKVHVSGVGMVNLPPKSKKFRGATRKGRGAVRKAVVTLKAGETISLT